LFSNRDEELVTLLVQLVQLDRSAAAIWVFLVKDDIHEADDASLGQIQELRYDLTGELLVVWEYDQSVL
jgi:hypothetical protein